MSVFIPAFLFIFICAIVGIILDSLEDNFIKWAIERDERIEKEEVI